MNHLSLSLSHNLFIISLIIYSDYDIIIMQGLYCENGCTQD